MKWNSVFKNVLSYILSAALISVLFSGCSAGSNTTKITLFNMKNEQATALQKAIDEYKKLNTNVDITLETYGGSQDFHAPLKAKMQSDPPAIFPITGVTDLNDYKDSVADLSDQPWALNCDNSLTEDVTIDGKIYGLPVAVEGYGYAINTKMFEAAGVDIMSMYTFNGMKAGFTKLKQKIDSGELKGQFPNLKAVFSMPAKETWVLGDHAIDPVLTKDFVNAKETFNAKTIPFKGADLYKQIIDFQVSFTEYANNPSVLTSLDYTSSLNQGFLLDSYAVIQQGCWIDSVIKQEKPDMLDYLDMIPYNLPDGSENGKFIVGAPSYWGVNKNLPEKEVTEAKNFLNWLYTSDAGREILVNDAGFILPFKDMDSSKLSTFSKRIFESFKSGNFLSSTLVYATPTSWSKDVAGADVQKYLSGADWTSLVSDMKNRWQEIRSTSSDSIN